MDETRVKKLLELVYMIYKSLDKDILRYINYLNSLQEYFNRYDFKDQDMINIIRSRIDSASILLYQTVSNHLSIKATVSGKAATVIRPVTPSCKTTSIRYRKLEHSQCLPQIRFSGEVATYDNMSIVPTETGYRIDIGKHSNNILNGISALPPGITNYSQHLFQYLDDETTTLTKIRRLLRVNSVYLQRYTDSFDKN